MKQRKKWVAPEDMPKPRVKPDLHPRKTMICVWWDWEGIAHWEMLKRNATVNKELYIAQLHRVNEAIRLKRPHQQGQTILLHNNARPHVAQVVKATLEELKLEVLQHLPYSLDLAPTSYYLFHSLSNHMRGVTFDNEEDLKNWLNKFFDTRPGVFWQNSIKKLVERWEEAVMERRIHNLLIYEVCSKSIRPFSLSPIRYEQTARAKRGCTHTHSRVIVKRFRPIRHSYLSV